MLREPRELPHSFGRRDAARLLIAAFVLVVGLAVGVAPDLAPTNSGLAAGTVASAAVRAPRDAVIDNPVETRAAQDAAAAAVPPQYDYTPQRAAIIAANQVAALQLDIAPVDDAFSTSKTPEALQAALATVMPSLPTSARSILVGLDASGWATVESAAEQLLLTVEESQEIRDPTTAPTLVSQEMPVGLSGSYQQLVAALVTPLVVANSTYSATLTQQVRDQAVAGVATVTDTLKAGQVIVDQGHLISAADMIKIHYFGLDESSTDWGKPAAWVALGALVSALLMAWMWRYRPEYWQRGRTLVLVGFIFLLHRAARRHRRRQPGRGIAAGRRPRRRRLRHEQDARGPPGRPWHVAAISSVERSLDPGRARRFQLGDRGSGCGAAPPDSRAGAGDSGCHDRTDARQ